MLDHSFAKAPRYGGCNIDSCLRGGGLSDGFFEEPPP